MSRVAIFLSFFLFAVPVRAEFSASGYLKNIYESSRSLLTKSPNYVDLTRARLSLDSSVGLGESLLEGMTGGAMTSISGKGDSAGLRLKAHVDYDHEVRAGTYLQSPDYRVFGQAEPPQYFNMDGLIGRGNSYDYHQRFYRAWAGIESEDSVARFGRQRIAWGTGKLWNPTDVLNPYVPTTIERDERRGVDAAYVRHGVGVLGQGEGAYALGDRWASTSALGRVRGNVHDVDVSVMGGKVAASTSSWMMGSDFSSNLWDGNLHGEWSYSELKTQTPYWRGLIGYEYSFSSSPPLPGLKDAWVLVEYFHNGAGSVHSTKYQLAQALSGQAISLAQNYLGFGFQKDLHPLVKAEMYEILNLDDGSHFFGPTITWNVLKNLYLSAGWEWFSGPPQSEYGRLPNVGFLQAQYYF